jgi:hypothetical protein
MVGKKQGSIGLDFGVLVPRNYIPIRPSQRVFHESQVIHTRRVLRRGSIPRRGKSELLYAEAFLTLASTVKQRLIQKSTRVSLRGHIDKISNLLEFLVLNAFA